MKNFEISTSNAADIVAAATERLPLKEIYPCVVNAGDMTATLKLVVELETLGFRCSQERDDNHPDGAKFDFDDLNLCVIALPIPFDPTADYD